MFQDTKADADAMVEEYVRMYTELTQNGKISEKIAQQQKIVDFANRKRISSCSLRPRTASPVQTSSR